MATAIAGGDRRQHVRRAIVDVAARLLQEQGPAALTTRGVAEAAGTQAPTIYRLFGDKDGLLDAVAEHVMTTYVASKAAAVKAADDTDPVVDLRAGWDTHIGFGLANPGLFALLNDPHRRSPAAAAGADLLRARVHRVALAGRLRVSEARAVNMVRASGAGAVLTLLALPPAEREAWLPDAMYDALSRTILTDTEVPLRGDVGSRGEVAAVALRAAAQEQTMLSEVERTMLSEWLDRILAAHGHQP